MADPADVLRDLIERRVDGRDLTPEQAERLAAELAERPELWRRHVRHSDAERIYTSLYRDHHLDVWLICWTGTQDTGLHDHDLSGGAVRVVEGELDEDRLRMGRASTPPATGPATRSASTRRASTTCGTPATRRRCRCTCTRRRCGGWATTGWTIMATCRAPRPAMSRSCAPT